MLLYKCKRLHSGERLNKFRPTFPSNICVFRGTKGMDITMKANIYDIAEKAGVSTATVSRIINNSGKVSDVTKERVLAVMTELNYYPSAFARGMVTNSMKTIGVLAVDIRDTYYANVTYTIEQYLSENSYNVILCNTGNELESKKQYINMLMSKKIDGLILVGSVFKDKKLDDYIIKISKNLPVAIINGHIEGENVYCIMNDDKQGVCDAVSYLKKTGKTKIVFLKDTDSYSAEKKASGAVGYPVYRAEKGIDGGYNCIKLLLEDNKIINGVVCSEDLIAVGVIKYLLEKGIKIPDDFSVIGFNNSVFSECSSPQITSVDSNMTIIGREAADTIIKVINKEKIDNKIILKSKLIKRGSTK